MEDLYKEYIKALSKNTILNKLKPSDRLDFYSLLMAKDYSGVCIFLKKKIPSLYSELENRLQLLFLKYRNIH